MLPLSPLQKFGEWLPDMEPLDSAGATEAKNVIPSGDEYKPSKGLVALTDALPDVCRGYVSVRGSDGTVYTFAGTDTGLYLRNGTSWSDVSKSGGYTGSALNRWHFVQYGDYILAANGVEKIQIFLIGTSSTFDDIATAPVAKYIAVINNFVMAVACDGDPFLTKWSALDDPTDWVANVATQSDSQPIVDIGELTGIVGSQNNGIILGTNGKKVVEFVGSPYIFTFNTIEQNMGCQVPGSVVPYANSTIYLGENGFYLYSPGGSKSIGHKKVDDWFKSVTSPDTKEAMWSVADTVNGCLLIGVPSDESRDYCDKILVYSIRDNRFSWIEMTTQWCAPLLTESVNVDDVDTFVDDIDTFMDDTVWAGGRITLSAFNSENKLCSFTGGTLDAILTTPEIQLNPNGRAFVSSIMVIGNYDTATMSVEYRNLPNQTVSETAIKSFEPSTGEANIDIDARFMRAKVYLTGDWIKVSGLKIRSRATGA